MPEPKRAPLSDNPAAETRPTLEREEFIGLEIPLEAPTSKGELAEAPRAAERPAGAADEEAFARDRSAETPGRTATNAEARARLGSVRFDAETSERIGQMMGYAAEQAALNGIRDEIDDAEAMRIAGHIDEPIMLGGRNVDQIPNFNDRDNDFGPPEVLVAPTTLPAVIETLPAFVNEEVNWLKLAQLPGFIVNHIRALGRFTFRSFACFAEHERHEAARGITDPMSTVTVLANFPGQNGPSSQRELDLMANWIAQEGTLVETDELEFPGAFPGYRPEIALLATAHDSFLMVRDTRAGGAPVEGLYIYHWKGGANAYRVVDGRVNLGRLDAGRAADRAELNAPMRQIGHGGGINRRNATPGPNAGRMVPGPRGVGQIRAGMERVARNDPGVLRAQMEALGQGGGLPAVRAPVPPNPYFQEAGQVVRRKGPKSLPVASSSTDAIAKATDLKRLRELGFMPHSSAEGPGLRLETGDGRTILLLAEKGKRLIDATAFRMFVSGPGSETVTNEQASVEDIVAELGLTGPRP